ncbi:glycosyl transferase family 2 [Fadolivirus algeromassiliense]|jgi:hypothetical protein|uniref:Glycosyl transferase family 2 n=1 Tax=Fadolivirus FV1/VV64 TaxID=3070911 RepID=A0A7D3URG3_9VIRU|nr:glycosyl transferase family 2 [Fadolivirus algeromassiliense]QKF94633.1 glycosyl transferase family 2 [Fadolivirus FV1/VV64]
MDNFNWRVYRELHKDLINAKLDTEQQIIDHWNKHGKYEGRYYKVTDVTPDFNWEEYKLLNVDLEEAGVVEKEFVELHWIRHGMSEKRKYKINNPSPYKTYLLQNYKTLYRINDLLNKGDDNIFIHKVINEHIIDNNTISIMMASSDRSKQTYFTLETISKSSYKNIQIILVDDSTNDPVDPNIIKKYGMHIELITIKNKFWSNPCVNYNIGFKYIRGNFIIIQNAEVCHVGDVLDYVINNVKDNEYYAFNVGALSDMKTNEELYKIKDMTSDNYTKIVNLIAIWYRHHKYNGVFWHFLVSMTKKTFDMFGGFDIDYALGILYDDVEFEFRVKNTNLKLINAPENIIGIHQWHRGIHPKIQMRNELLWNWKYKYYCNNKKYLFLYKLSPLELVRMVNSL